MKNATLHFSAQVVLFFLLAVLIPVNCFGQCANDNSPHNTWAAPTVVGQEIILTTCIFGGEYVPMTGLVAGAVYNFNTCGDTDFDTQITIYPAGGGSSVAYNDNFCGYQSSVNFTVPTAGNYDILVDHNDCQSNFICMTLKATLISLSPAVNDACANAIDMVCGDVATGNTALASNNDAPPNCDISLNTTPGVWYHFVGTGGDVEVSTSNSGTNYDTKLGVFSGSCAALTCVGGNDDGGSGFTSIVNFTSVPGTDYYIYVTGFGIAIGTFELSLTCATSCTPNISINDVSQMEGTPGGTTAFNFTVSIDDICANPVTVNYNTTYGSANASDLTSLPSGSVTFSGTQTSKTITVNVNQDCLVESNETFFVNLTSTSAGTITDNQGTGTIQNDDTTPSISCPAGLTPDPIVLGTSCSATMPDYTSQVTATFNSSCAALVQSPAPGSTVSSAGPLTITFTVADGENPAVSCSVIVQVADNTPPQISCPTLSIVNDCSSVVPDLTQPAGTVLANSSADFSGTQGSNGWQYGRYSAFDTQGFSELPNWTGFVWNNPGVGAILDFPQLDANGGHPQFEGLTWAVRRWTSNYNGEVNLSGIFSDRDINCGDGANVRIFLNETQVYEYLNITPASNSYNFNVNVAVGDKIDFVIDPKFDAACDDTHLDAVITTVNGVSPTDNCGVVNISQSPAAGTVVGVGTTNITVTAFDADGNSNPCTTSLTVQDNNFPVASCKNITVQLGATGSVSISATDVDNGSTDNCGSVSLAIDVSSFDCTNIGTQTVTLTVTDNAMNSATCTATATVSPFSAPPGFYFDLTACESTICPPGTYCPGGTTEALLCPAGTFQSVPGATECISCNPGYISPTLGATACEACPSGTYNPVSGAIECLDCPAGTYNPFEAQVECPVCTLSITCAADVTVNVDPGTCESAGLMLTDPAVTNTCPIVSMVNDAPAAFPVGTTVVTWTTTDEGGVTATCTQNVTVLDNEVPTAQCQNVTIQLDDNGNGSITTAQIDNGSSDACGIASLSVSPTSFYCANVGGNTVTLTATDVNGNSATCTATVTVQDNLSPNAQCQNVTVQLDNNGTGAITAAQINNGSSDGCGIGSLSVSPVSFTCTNLGDNIVTLTATDNNGNESTCTATVTVVDNIAPELESQCPIDIAICGAQNVSWTSPTATDNCGIVSSVSSHNPGDMFNAGTTTVTYTFYDAADLSVSCDFTVTVQPAPELEMGESNLPLWCQGVKILVVKVNNLVQLTGPVTYSWSDGLGNTPQVVALENGTYTVTVTDGNNCSTVGTVIVNEDLSTLLSSHTIIAGQQLDMSSSTVLNGGVGVLNGEEVTIQNNTDITTFLRSATAYIDGSSTVANYINSDSPVSLPPFVSNPYNDFNDIYVPSGGSMTLSGSNYGNVTVGKNATLTINNGTIYLRSLKVNTGSTVIFNQPTNVMVRKKVSFGLLNNVNIGGPVTVIYSGDQTSVGQGSIIEANIYAPEGLEVNDSGASLTTYMIGLFIANDGVYSDDNVVWNWNLNCGDASTGNNGDFAEPSGQEAQEFLKEEPTDKLISALNVYPNPTSGIINIETPSLLGHKVEMTIYDPLGKAVLRRIIDELKIPIIQVDLASSQFTNGFYHVSLRTETEMVSVRFILNK